MSKQDVKYSKAEVDQFIKTAISCTFNGLKNWYESDNTWIVDKGTKQKIENCELAGTPGVSPLQQYIIPLLKEKGIEMNVDDAL